VQEGLDTYDSRRQFQYAYGINDGRNPVQETSGAVVLANILPGLGVDEFLTRTDVVAGVTSHFLTDALGSPVAVADNAGFVQTEYAYESFGRTTATGTLNSSSYQYTGRENDGTGLYYYRARFYNPELARFLSEDPTGFRGGINHFAYVGSNPIRWVDPNGTNPAVRGAQAAYGAAVVVGAAILGAARATQRAINDAINAVQDYINGLVGPGGVQSSGDRAPGFWPGDAGSEEWGRRNGLGADEGRRRFHKLKQDCHGRPRDPWTVNPDTGDVKDHEGETQGNLNDTKAK
jgi:RHS repeat-associated protein